MNLVRQPNSFVNWHSFYVVFIIIGFSFVLQIFVSLLLCWAVFFSLCWILLLPNDWRKKNETNSRLWHRSDVDYSRQHGIVGRQSLERNWRLPSCKHWIREKKSQNMKFIYTIPYAKLLSGALLHSFLEGFFWFFLSFTFNFLRRAL